MDRLFYNTSKHTLAAPLIQYTFPQTQSTGTETRRVRAYTRSQLLDQPNLTSFDRFEWDTSLTLRIAHGVRRYGLEGAEDGGSGWSGGRLFSSICICRIQFTIRRGHIDYVHIAFIRRQTGNHFCPFIAPNSSSYSFSYSILPDAQSKLYSLEWLDDADASNRNTRIFRISPCALNEQRIITYAINSNC